MHFNKIFFTGLLVVLIVFAYMQSISSATVAVSGAVGNTAPTISAVYIARATDGACDSGDYPSSGTTVATFVPGTDALCVKVVVSDPNGNDNISLTSTDSNILVWSDSNSATAAQAESAHGWDRHKIVAFEDCTTAATKSSMAASDTAFCGELPPDADTISDSGISVKDINGSGWDVNVYVQDSNRNSTNSKFGLVNSVTVSTSTGLSLSSSTCTFSASSDTNFAMTCSGSPTELITFTHTGNISQKVYVYMSTIFSSPDTLDGSMIYWKTSQISTPSTTDINANATSITSTNCNSQIANLWERGAQSTSVAATKSIYWYMALSKLLPGAYSGGVITITSYAQSGTCS